MKTREECKKGIISGGLLAGIMGLIALYMSENRRIPITNEHIYSRAIDGVMMIPVVIMIIGFIVMLANASALSRINREQNNYHTNHNNAHYTNKTTASKATAGNPGYVYKFCGQCGKKLRISGKGRLEVTCPICGHKFIITI